MFLMSMPIEYEDIELEATSKTTVGEGSYENPWLYKGTNFTSDDIDDLFGFVYCITNKTNGRQYIGRK